MTTPENKRSDRSRDEVLAGEYVLGVLSLPDRLRVEYGYAMKGVPGDRGALAGKIWRRSTTTM